MIKVFNKRLIYKSIFFAVLVVSAFNTYLYITQNSVSTNIVFTDDFEGGEIADFWRDGGVKEGRYLPEAVSLSKEYQRSGEFSAKLIVKKGFIKQVVNNSIITERTELGSRKHALLGREVWYAYSILVPKEFPVIDNRLVISQFKQSGLEIGPIFAQRYRNDRHYLSISNLQGDLNENRKFELPELKREVWHEFVFNIRYSKQSDGYVILWMDGKRAVTYNGKTAHETAKNLFYHKMGLYRDQWPAPMTLYFDDYVLTLDDLFVRESYRFTVEE